MTIVAIVLAVGGAATAHAPTMAWPYRVRVSDVGGGPVAFQALTRGAELIVPAGPRTGGIRELARGDTLSATTPAQYALDLEHGPVVFFTSGRDSIRVTIGRTPFESDRVSAQGRRLTARLVNRAVVIDAR